ncbi:hypothetical protein BL250_14080 [Erwinia sp. OLTSP20]|nr:hypothetical protein BV501_03450 [Erwinia sp. OAMSP11]PIJ68601.1 hypothetical protein BK416_16275 [Erwinia sp. OLSSP12]PIJ83418.1 hypothetical protein BLD47_04445 [Erwinia sp. OLCASP19]PIJ86251.1 hypothetical protein BLD46_03875 [Erwinia sp. OLMTSP26]PIJ88506.1 hypothetical protein BLD49_01995 [Erwinia sp. OLMDSP33]PIJ90387.1 hypothetical protein BL250_14080 [Erwinia sp. OLTSP20]PIJ94974.1 hypothetical protein BL249_01310 [Erwinia sp. OLFS4]
MPVSLQAGYPQQSAFTFPCNIYILMIFGFANTTIFRVFFYHFQKQTLVWCFRMILRMWINTLLFFFIGHYGVSVYTQRKYLFRNIITSNKNSTFLMQSINKITGLNISSKRFKKRHRLLLPLF